MKEVDLIRQREMDITKERIQKILEAGANVILTTKGIDDLALKVIKFNIKNQSVVEGRDGGGYMEHRLSTRHADRTVPSTHKTHPNLVLRGGERHRRAPCQEGGPEAHRQGHGRLCRRDAGRHGGSVFCG